MLEGINRVRFLIAVLVAFIAPACVAMAIGWTLTLSTDAGALVGLVIGGLGAPAILALTLSWWMPMDDGAW